MSRTTLRERVLNHPSAVLLVVQLLGVLVYPFMESSAVGRGAFEAFGVIVLILAVTSVRFAAGPIWPPLLLALLAGPLSILSAIVDLPGVHIASAVVHALFYLWAAIGLLIYMLRDRTVTVDELFAIGATFTLVAWAFAYVFQFVQLLQPGAFVTEINPAPMRTWMELLFLSFTNLTSTGYSDIIAATAHARSVVMIEQLAGLGYIALIVTRLIGFTMNRRIAKSTVEEEAAEFSRTAAAERAKLTEHAEQHKQDLDDTAGSESS
ncbi:MAG: ion channel [Propionibacteriaceae bacterium]